jgi:hypothetical protein
LILDKINLERHVPTEEKLYDTGTRLEESPIMSLLPLPLQCGLAKSTAHIGRMVLMNKTTVIHILLFINCEERRKCCRWFQGSVFNGLTDSELQFYSDVASFTLHGYLNSQNNRYCRTEDPHAVHEVPLNDLKLGLGVKFVRGG